MTAFWCISGILIVAAFAWAIAPLVPRRRKPAVISSYGHPFDVVAEVKQRLPRPPDDCWWELGVIRKNHRAQLTLSLHTWRGATVKEMAEHGARQLSSRTIDLTVRNAVEYADLYRLSPAATTTIAFDFIVSQTVAWATRKVRIYGEPDGPQHHEVIT